MAGCERNQVREPLERDAIGMMDESRDGIMQREEFGH
jgi:hypothetical protein